MTSPRSLVEGFHRFSAQHFRDDDALYRQLVEEGQTPKFLVVACCDSRVDPALILNCAPGDLFVIRNVANLVPPDEHHSRARHGTSAALEYGVRTLGVEHVIVLGHAHCGGIRALIDGRKTANEESYINSWMRLAEHARAQGEAAAGNLSARERERLIEQAAIRGSLDNLLTFSWIRNAVEAGQLHLHGWYFDMDHGQLLGLDPADRSFKVL